MSRRALAPLLFATAGLAMPALGAAPVEVEIPGARLILDVRPSARPGFVPEAMPTRFVLLEDGTLVVGGHSGLATVRAEREFVKALDKRWGQLEHLAGRNVSVTFGPGDERCRLRVPKERIDVTAVGDPAQAPPELRPLAMLVSDLAAFDHPGLRPLQPAEYWASARAEALAGGCRVWRGTPRVAELLERPQALPASMAAGWPTGAYAASVCEDGRRFSLTLRPLLPGQRP